MRGAPPLRCAVGYATALHDITHIVLSYSRDDDRVAGRALSKFVGCPTSGFCLRSPSISSGKGPKVIAKVAKEQPAAYLKICAMLVPKEMKVEPSSGVKAMSDEQLDAAPDALCEILAARAGEAAKT